MDFLNQAFTIETDVNKLLTDEYISEVKSMNFHQLQEEADRVNFIVDHLTSIGGAELKVIIYAYILLHEMLLAMLNHLF